ncbi:NAD(P)-dependent oxidoreductase [Sphingobium sp.]|uniref:NAD(P)-dependent oxidoreductase n=1 Tax=Sphingobium sp. TaxID=1912891 RepID=UPI002B73E481|nr:NAD(P)-dependent oxidoreductase [Sphingobium sp.]HUD92687.1 NAD(P)-dependent oxidoreductase [Sphingobium sp.]
MELGFVGLGDQGGPIAQRLLETGYSVTLWARRPETLEPYAGMQAKRAPDLRTLAERCDWIGICVFDDAGVREICEEIMPYMRAGSTIVVHSTVDPGTCRALAVEAAECGLTLIDAPVSGGNAGAHAGTLTVMVGASPAAFAMSEPFFRAYGSLVVRVGEPGAGQAAKLINNTLMAVHAGLAQAALRTGEALGLCPEALTRIVNASSGRSYGFEIFSGVGVDGLARVANILDKDLGLLANCIASDAPMQPYIELTGDLLEHLHATALKQAADGQ